MFPNASSSRHHFPTNSILFDSVPDFRAPSSSRQHNPTLVIITEAADMNVTALPAIPLTKYPSITQPPPITTFTTEPVAKKKKVGVWSRIWSKLTGKKSKRKGVKEGIGHGNEGSGGVKVKKMEIGEPMGFRHERTGGALGLRGGEEGDEDEDEDEWEDVVEETRGYLRTR